MVEISSPNVDNQQRSSGLSDFDKWPGGSCSATSIEANMAQSAANVFKQTEVDRRIFSGGIRSHQMIIIFRQQCYACVMSVLTNNICRSAGVPAPPSYQHSMESSPTPTPLSRRNEEGKAHHVTRTAPALAGLNLLSRMRDCRSFQQAGGEERFPVPQASKEEENYNVAQCKTLPA